jgi:hypothetical protein
VGTAIDELARRMSEPMSRRRALRLIATGAAAAVLPGVRPGSGHRAIASSSPPMACQTCPKSNQPTYTQRCATPSSFPGLCIMVCCPPDWNCCTNPTKGVVCCPPEDRCGPLDEWGYPHCECTTPCGAQCCNPGEVCASDPDGNQTCCPPGLAACGSQCCEAGAECCKGECCKPGQICHWEPRVRDDAYCADVCKAETDRATSQIYDPKTQCCTKHGIEQKYPIHHLERCRDTLVPRKGFKPSSNGCGTNGQQFAHSYGKAHWLSVCNSHDLCYDTCGKSKEDCDGRFEKDIVHACKAAYPRGTRGRKRCLDFVADYIDAVRIFGHFAYEESQSKACQCCP